MRSNVFALDLKTGKLLWRGCSARATRARSGSLAVDGSRVYGERTRERVRTRRGDRTPGVAALPRHGNGAAA
jgi:hypothetical protein